MKRETLVLLVLRVLLVSTSTCEINPGQLQCLAYNNRFMLPWNSKCNPFRKNCRMGDLIDTRVASCTLRYSSNVQHSLTKGHELGYYRCIPQMRSLKNHESRIVSVDFGEPRCVGVRKTGRKVFTCGLKGTRCVCDAPKGSATPTKNQCRCQFFIDFCSISKVCSDPKAVCLTEGNKVTCMCPRSQKLCSPGINQCTTDPSVCGSQDECIELYDGFSSWTVGAKESEDGYACVNKEDINLLRVSTYYCIVTSEKLLPETKAQNHIDACCFRQLICGSKDNSIKGNILTYRPCYCSTVFRNCIRRYGAHIGYQDIASAVIKSMNQQKSCQMNERNLCDPRKPKTCSKGDLINPKIAHCRINCKSGPLLPIGQRMCSIRQCIPPYHVNGVRIIDIPNKKTSSLCKAVRTTPLLCGKGDTRCVCDSRPSGLTFTDRCRCQYWPLEI